MALETLTFNALQTRAEDARLVRKSLKMLGFEANINAPVPDLATGFLDATDRTKISIDLTVWTPFGILTPDGMERTTDVNDEKADGYNYLEPVRTDIISAPKKLTVTALQTKTRLDLQYKFGMDLSNVAATADKGFGFDEPTVPIFPYKRLLFIDLDYFDGDQSKPIYGIDLYPRAKQAKLPNDVRKRAGYPETQLEFDISTDPVLGTPGRHWLDGPGYDMAQQGFKPAA